MTPSPSFLPLPQNKRTALVCTPTTMVTGMTKTVATQQVASASGPTARPIPLPSPQRLLMVTALRDGYTQVGGKGGAPTAPGEDEGKPVLSSSLPVYSFIKLMDLTSFQIYSVASTFLFHSSPIHTSASDSLLTHLTTSPFVSSQLTYLLHESAISNLQIPQTNSPVTGSSFFFCMYFKQTPDSSNHFSLPHTRQAANVCTSPKSG